MKLNNTKKIALAVTSAALAVSCAVGGTMAWLNSITQPVTNTITLGKVCITLDESKLKPDGTLDNKIRVQENTYNNVEPGVKECKDPTVHVKQGSENCYIFLKVGKEFTAKAESASGTPSGYKTLQEQILANHWETYTPATPKPGYDYYIYKGTTTDYIFHPSSSADTNLPVFSDFAINTSLQEGATIPNIVVKAGAIQSNGFADKNAAFAALGL